MANNQSAYLELLKRCLTDQRNAGRVEMHAYRQLRRTFSIRLLLPIQRMLEWRNFTIAKMIPVSKEERESGYDWPAQAETMIGLHRLNDLEDCIRIIIKEGVTGDLFEAGVWRGGAGIFMRAVLKELGEEERRVWLADSFAGLPKPDTERYPRDKAFRLFEEPLLRVSLEEVQHNFRNYGLLDGQVIFLEGWFRDTLPSAPVKNLALLRIDADSYESTIQALENLYPKLQIGGFVIIDDYHAFPNCRQAVIDYRERMVIGERIVDIDKEAVRWRRER